MRRLNVKLLLYLTGGFFAFAGLLFVVHRLQAASIGTGLMWQADQADREGRPDQVARYLRRYLEFEPNDLDTRARLGRTLADPRVAVTPIARNRARFCLEEVLSNDPDRHDVRRCLVRLALDVRQFDLALEHLNILKQKCPGDGEVAGLIGRYQELKGEGEGALESFRAAVRAAPDAADNYPRLIQMLRREDAGQHGDLFREAESHLGNALARAPDHPGVRVAAAELAQDRGDLKAARAHLEHALKVQPRDGKVHVALARLELREDRRPAAIAALRRGLKNAPKEDRYELNWTLANLLIDGGELDEARAVVGQIQEESGGSGSAEYLQGRTLMHQGRWFEAARILESVRPSFKSVPALMVQVDLLLGACYENLDEPAQQLAACARAVETDRASVLARQGIAAAQWALGNHDAAIEALKQAVEINRAMKRPWTGRTELVRMMVQRTLQRDSRDWRETLAELDAAEKEQPGSPELALMRAEIYASEKRYDDAQAILLRAVQAQPRGVAAWAALAALCDRRGEPDKALAMLEQAEKQAGDSPELRLARARHLAGRDKEQAAPALRKLEDRLDTFTPPQQAALLHGLAEAHLRCGSLTDAERLWGQLAMQPSRANDVRLRMLLFDVALQRRDDAAAQKVLEEIKALEGGESPLWLLGQASRRLALARQGDQKALKEARALLEKAAAVRPGWPAVLLARAEAEELDGNVDLAIAGYRRALDAGVRNPRVVRQLVQLLGARQRYDEAEQVMRKMAQAGPLSDDLKRLELLGQVQKGDFAAARQMLDKTAPADSKDFRDQLWRGKVLASNGPSEEAEKALRQAVALADTRPETWVALVQYLAVAGQGDAARAESENARGKLAGPEAPLALAQCYESVGDAEKARAQYRAAVAARPDDLATRRTYIGFCVRVGDSAEAEKHLRDIVGGTVKAGDAEVAWARRGLALTLASAPDPKRSSEALTLVGFTSDAQGNLSESPAPAAGYSVEEQIVRARVLAAQGRKAARDRAVALLEALHKRQALPADEQLLLAQMYQRGGDDLSWARARDLMTGLIAVQPRHPTYLTVFAQSLLDRGEVREAERLIDRLEQVEKGRPRGATSPAVELKALALEQRGKGAEALELLKAYAEAPEAPPQRLLLLAGLHGRLGQVKEAFDLCEQARAKCPAEAVGGAGVAVLRAARGRPGVKEKEWRGQATRAETWLKEALGKAPDNVTLRLQLADLSDLLGRDAEVEGQYRAVLQRDPRNHVALNNLAWLLGQRQGGAAEALTLIDRAIEAHGPRSELLDTRAVIYLTMNLPGKAVADLERAVAEGPTPTKLFHLSQAYHRAQNVNAARQALARATAAGLTADRLPPSEREALRRLQTELKQ